MMSGAFEDRDALQELRFALAEADAQFVRPQLRERIVAAALASRPAGDPSQPPARITGLEAFRRAVGSLDHLLAELSIDEWRLHALRDLDVQGLVGHLIGVEECFAAALAGQGGEGATDHVAATQPYAVAQAERAPADTHRDWLAAAGRTLDLAESCPDPFAPADFFGVTMPLDDVMVVRSFELWVHEEDVRTACGRPLSGPDDARLFRMTRLVTALLPIGMALADRPPEGRVARLVLTGPGGGTFLVPPGTDHRRADARIVLDATVFCRVVGARQAVASAGALLSGDEELGSDVLAGAARLALD